MTDLGLFYTKSCLRRLQRYDLRRLEAGDRGEVGRHRPRQSSSWEARRHENWGIFKRHFWGELLRRRHAVAVSLEEAGDKLFTFTRFPKSQWKSIRTSNAIERLHEEFKRRIKTQAILPSAETAAMLFWALLASGQITMRKVDGWRSLTDAPSDQIIDLAA